MRHVAGFRCYVCQAEYPFRNGTYACGSCGGNLEVIYDYGSIRKGFTREKLAHCGDFSIWRYLPILPVESSRLAPTQIIGWTPLHRARRIGSMLGLANLYLKDDGRNPSASLKDRASAIALVRAMEEGAEIVTGASTGNAGSSMACLSASVGIPAVIFVPQTAPRAKIAQLLIFGARVVTVKGTYDDAFDLCLRVSAEFGWPNRNTGYNPYTREGKKTVVLEIFEQMGWDGPDAIFVPVGDGNIISGVWKGIRDLHELGFIERTPRIIACQSKLSNAIALAWRESVSGRIEIRAVQATTIADSISVDLPRDGVAAVRAIRESGGEAVEVSDEEILDCIRYLAKNEGIFGEPAGVASLAAFRKMVLEGKMSSHEKVVCLITGSGLKDIDSAMRVAGEPVLIEPTIEAVRSVFAGGESIAN